MTPFERNCDTDEARACYTRIQKRLREQNAWRDEYALGLAPVAAAAAAYLRDARARLTISKTATPETAKLLDALL